MKATLFVALLAAVALLAWRTTPPDANAPAQLDPSTPAVQGGFRLVGISRGDQDGDYEYHEGGAVRELLATMRLAPPPVDFHTLMTGQYDSDSLISGGTGLWVIPPPLSSTGSTQYSATALTSTGQRLSLDSRPVDGMALLYVIPSGYSSRVKYIDTTVTDGNGHSAHWRITHLPPMHHVLALNTALNPTATADGLRLSFHAWHDDLPSSPFSHHIGIGAFVTASSKASEQLGLGGKPLQRDIRFDSNAVTPEWLPDGYKPAPNGIQTTSGLPDRDDLARDAVPVCYPLAERSPSYAPQDSRIQVRAILQTYDTYDERVTFHGTRIVRGRSSSGETCYYLSVPNLRSIATPSGITLVLPIQSLHNVTTNASGTSLCFEMGMNSAGPIALPKSPLWQRYRKPVTAEIVMPPPFGASGYSSSSARVFPLYTENLSLDTPHAYYPTGRHDFTVLVRQRVDVDTTPLTLTLPIEQKQPTKP